MFRLDEKLARIANGSNERKDFIIADAKDPDMGPGLHAVGPARQSDGSAPRLRTREEFLKSIEAAGTDLRMRIGTFARSRVNSSTGSNGNSRVSGVKPDSTNAKQGVFSDAIRRFYCKERRSSLFGCLKVT